MPLGAVEITSDKLLLVEGEDERNFFTALCTHLGLKGMQIIPYKGKPNLPNVFVAVLNTPNFDQVSAYAIIRDADVSQQSALESIKDLLQKHGQICPQKHAEIASAGSLKVGVFIMPGNSATSGMLEDLCLQTVAGHEAMPCVESFMDCLKAPGATFHPQNPSKAKVQAFLAAMPETVPSLGVAALKGYWQFNHQALSELCAFLQELSQ
jgi:hypothetical protein